MLHCGAMLASIRFLNLQPIPCDKTDTPKKWCLARTYLVAFSRKLVTNTLNHDPSIAELTSRQTLPQPVHEKRPRD